MSFTMNKIKLVNRLVRNFHKKNIKCSKISDTVSHLTRVLNSIL